MELNAAFKEAQLILGLKDVAVVSTIGDSFK